ncbi:hypothetical protein E4U55_005837 [Claviceps digitariae]|nr:hypothetical protein E4U55_005837 [Claviceps digitariae]
MNIQTLRSACARAKPEVQKTGVALKNYFRDFSTSESLAEDDASARGRSRAATSEINSFLKRGNSSAPAKPLASQVASTSQPKVLDIRSLPRGLSLRGLGTRGRGGALRGRGQGQIGAGPQGQQPGRTQSPTSGFSGNRFSGNRFSGSGAGYVGRGGSSLRGGRGGRGSGRGGRATAAPKGRRTKRGDNKDEAPKPFGKRVDPFDVMDPYEEQFDKEMRFGAPTAFQPSLTLDSLAEFAPAIPTSESGRKATVLGNLCALGNADPVGAPQYLQAAGYAADLQASGVRFFADPKAREEAEQYLQQQQEQASAEQGSSETKTVTVSDPEISIRQVIFEQAVRGQHQKMKFATGPIGISRTWHLRSETWTKSDTDKFERKVASLMGSVSGASKKVGNTANKAAAQ